MDQLLDMLFLTFATNKIGEISEDIEDIHRVSSASTRLQLAPLINASKNLGFTTSVWSVHAEKPEHLYEIKKMVGIKGLIIGKMSSDKQRSIDSMVMANSAVIFHFISKNIPITLLYSDNHITRKDAIGSFYRDILSCANTVITPSNALKEEVNKYTKGKTIIHVVKDPWQVEKSPFGKPQNPKEIANLIWFGNGRNIEYLKNILPNIMMECSSSSHFNLKILTRKNAITNLKKLMPKTLKSKRKWTIDFIEWDDMNQPHQFIKNLTESHISLIPSDPKDPRKLGVSHNRLVDSIQSGCIAIASPLKSYLDLSNTCLVGENFSAMIDFAIANYSYLCNKFESNRDSSLLEFSPEENLKRWANLAASLNATQ